MKLATLLMIAFCLHVSARGVSQTVTLSGRSMPLQKVFGEIKRQTGYLFFYRNEDLAGATPVTVELKAFTVPKALEMILRDQPLSYSIQGNTIFITKKAAASVMPPEAKIPDADTAIITLNIQGVVYNEDKTAMDGATVVVQSDRRMYTTNADGLFNILAVPAGSTILITHVGYAPYRLRAERGQTSWSVQMTRVESKLDQVQVIGYGTTTRELLTSPISSVKSKDIRNFPVGSFDQMLEGMASGVFVVSGSGAPGKSPGITIRGQNSINVTGPLILIDGVPTLGGLGGAAGGNDFDPLIGLNPADIESIDILKDAGSTAIYGARAAGGVILITTKRGKKGKAQFTINGTQGSGVPAGRLHLLGTKDYVALRREGFRNDNPGQPLPPALANLDSITETNWQNVLYKPTTVSEYKASLAGGNAETQFFLSGGYRRETNPLSKKKGLERGTVRLTIDHQEGRKLKLSASIAGSRTDDNNTADQNSSPFSPLGAGVLAPPDQIPYDSTGNYSPIQNPDGSLGNPLAALAVKLKNTLTQFKSTASLNYEFFSGFSFHTDLGYDYNSIRTNIYIPVAIVPVLNNPSFDAEQSDTYVTTYSLEPQFRYNKSWGQKNRIDAVAGSTFQKSITNITVLDGLGFASDDIQELSAAATTFGTTADITYAFTSLFGRVNYAYDSKYIVSGSFRRDGSSRFGPDRRFGNFWAASAAWVFSRESFARNWQFLSNGKLRGSYGLVGSDALGDFTYIDTWIPGSYGGRPGSRPASAESPDVHWESTAKFDAGLDLSFLNDRLGLVINYFNNRTGNMLIQKPLPSQTGFTVAEDNLPAVVQNRGIEFEVNTVNIRTRDFQWTSKLNITHSANILKKFPGLDQNANYKYSYYIGKPLNSFTGYKFRGVDPNTGNPKYDGFNLDGTPTDPNAINPGRQFIASFNPGYYGGFTNTFSWKGFSLDVFLQFVGDVKILNALQALNNSSATNTNQLTDVLRRWQHKGDITDVPRSATAGTAWWIQNIDAQSSRFVANGSYMRLKNLTFAYSLPAPTLARLKMKEVRIYVTGQNLAVMTPYKGVDPETGFDVAPPRVIVGGIDLVF